MSNPTVPTAAEGMSKISRRKFIHVSLGAATLGVIAGTATLSNSAPSRVAEADPIFNAIDIHREARDAYEAALAAAPENYVEEAAYFDSEKFRSIDGAESETWAALIETAPTTPRGLAAFSAYVLHSKALTGEIADARAMLTTIAVASAKFAHLCGEAGR